MKITRAKFQHPAVLPRYASARAFQHAAKMSAMCGAPELSRYFRAQMRQDAKIAVSMIRILP